MSRALFLFETVRREFQGSAIFGYRTDDVFRCSRRDLGLNFESDGHGRSHQPGEMCNYLVGDTTCIAAYTSRIETHGAVKPFWPVLGPRFRQAAGRSWF